MVDRYARLMRRMQESILQGKGQLDLAVREALAIGATVPEPLASYAEKVRRYAYKVTDEDIRALEAAGYSQDQMLEATLSIALGAAQKRLDAGLRALDAFASLDAQTDDKASSTQQQHEKEANV